LINSHKKKVARTAHYYSIGTPSKSIKKIWIVCHGYGQLAERVINKFDGITDNETLILAPEGLSSFYWQNKGTGESQWRGRQLAASWMTRNNRLDEIEDYTNYIKGLYDEYVPQLADNVEITLMGFSQGCATQMRWIMGVLPDFHRLVLWAGMVPEDLDYTPHQAYFAAKEIHFVYGDDDMFLTPERLDWYLNFVKEQGLNMNIHSFEGKHVVDIPTLKKLFFDKNLAIK